MHVQHGMRLLTGVLTFGLVISAGTAAWAQDEQDAQSAAGTEPVIAPAEPAAEVPVEPLPPATDQPAVADEFQEVVVTATRRESSLMKIPLAISEISGEALEANVIRDTQSLVQQAPSLNIQFSGSEANATIRIRGIGTGGGNAGFESSVGVFIDGVYLPRPGLALTDLVDVERVEVLRGPQGTLFGKNTTVGAISIHTRKPSFVPEADLRIGAGNFNARLASGSFSFPVVDDLLAVRLTGQYNERDGYITNQFNGEKYHDRNRYVLRGQALLTPTDAITLRLIAQRNDKDERCCVAPYTQYNPATADEIRRHDGTVFNPVSEYEVAFDYTDTFSKAGEDSFSAHLDWDFSGFSARGLLSYGKGFAEDKRDGDFSDVDLAYQPFVNAQTEIKTGEFSVQGDFGLGEWLNIDWLGGVFYSDEQIGAQAQTLLGEEAGSFLLGPPVPPGTQVPLYPAGTGNNVTAFQDGTSASLFTHNVFKLPWGFDATVGLRYLTENKEGGGQADSDSPSCALPLTQNPQPVAPGAPNSAMTVNSLRALCGADPYFTVYEDSRVTNTFALGKNFDFGLYTYVGISSGFKSGGINLNPVSTVGGTLQFRPETIDNFEVGVRLPLFDNAVQLRATYFSMELKDYQVNSFDGTTFSVTNAEQVLADGIEFESDWRVFKGLSLKGNVTYTEAIYGDDTRDLRQANGSALPLKGKQLTNAPKWVSQVSMNYVAPLPHGMSFFGSLSHRYQSEVNTGVDLDPAKGQDAYGLLNGRIGLRFPGDWELAANGSNLTDQFYRQIIFNAVTRPPTISTSTGASPNPGSYNGYPGNPRFFGVELRKRF